MKLDHEIHMKSSSGTLPNDNISAIVEAQKQYFKLGETRNLKFRISQLKKLMRVIKENQDQITEALKDDLNKSGFDTYFELSGIFGEIEYALKHLKQWIKPKRVSVPMHQFLSAAQVQAEPLGVGLIIGPWNYPFNLLLSPLVGAIAAGNCSVLKPSEFAPSSSATIANVLTKSFNPEFLTVIEGDSEIAKQLLLEPFDHIFFTGGTKVGKCVMSAAAENLTPVILELGGKSPCIVDITSHLDYTAKRIVWGKFINAGQTCTAPDYLLVDQRIKDQLMEKIKFYIKEFYGKFPQESRNYSRIINSVHFIRLKHFINNGRIVIGGDTDDEDLYISPTVLDEISWDDPVMREEIFGPILPVIGYTKLDEAITMINDKPKPLSLYFFSEDKQKQSKIVRETMSGGICFNDTVMHLAVPSLPFGGIGASGMGRYHGKAGFDGFSYQRSILKKSFLLDLKWRYYPRPRKKS
jgi:aldehyde dehydrogenase (NAD+)